VPNFISEDQIEQALLQRLEQVHKFEILRCHCKDPEDLNHNSGRTNKRDVILFDRLRTEESLTAVVLPSICRSDEPSGPYAAFPPLSESVSRTSMLAGGAGTPSSTYC